MSPAYSSAVCRTVIDRSVVWGDSLRLGFAVAAVVENETELVPTSYSYLERLIDTNFF
jgi:hypothetical protein